MDTFHECNSVFCKRYICSMPVRSNTFFQSWFICSVHPIGFFGGEIRIPLEKKNLMMTRSFAEDKRIVDTKLKGSYSIFCECTVVSPFVLQYRQRIHLHKERPRSRVTTFLPAFARCCKKRKK